MAVFGDCLRGGQLGLRVDTEELKRLRKLKNVSCFDEWMPVPNAMPDCGNNVHSHGQLETVYWEVVSGGMAGSHGWCCRLCGKVVQWG